MASVRERGLRASARPSPRSSTSRGTTDWATPARARSRRHLADLASGQLGQRERVGRSACGSDSALSGSGRAAPCASCSASAVWPFSSDSIASVENTLPSRAWELRLRAIARASSHSLVAAASHPHPHHGRRAQPRPQVRVAFLIHLTADLDRLVGASCALASSPWLWSSSVMTEIPDVALLPWDRVSRQLLFVPLDGAPHVAASVHHGPEVAQRHRDVFLVTQLAGDGETLLSPPASRLPDCPDRCRCWRCC